MVEYIKLENGKIAVKQTVEILDLEELKTTKAELEEKIAICENILAPAEVEAPVAEEK